MAKAPLITETDRTNIAMVFRDNPKERADIIRAKVSELSHRDIGLSTVQRELVKLRKAHKAGDDKDELDAPWNIGSIAKYPIQSQHIPSMIRYAKMWQTDRHKRMTIRQAQWVDRLYDFPINEESKIQEQQLQQELRRLIELSVLGEINLQNKKGYGEIIQKLETLRDKHGSCITSVAAIFSELERWSEIQGITFDTSRFDDEYLEVMIEKVLVYKEKETAQKRTEGKSNG